MTPPLGPVKDVCLLYAYPFEFPSESGMAIQIVSDGHALATLGATVQLYTFPSPVHRPHSTGDALGFYGLAEHPGLRVTRLPFRSKALRKKLAAPFFWTAVTRDVLRHRSATVAVLSRSRKITGRLRRLRGLLRQRWAILQEIHEDGVQGLLPPDGDSRRIGRELAHFRGIDGIIATSPVVGRYLAESGGLGARVRSIPNGANVERFLPVRKSFDGWGGRSEYVLGYVGGFNEWKGVPLVLETLCHLPPHVRLVVMGGKEKYRAADREWLIGTAERLRIADRVTYRGFVRPADLPAAMSALDIVLLPLGENPVGRLFTSPLKLFEYMAAGLPIIAPAFPTITPFLEDHVTALLVDPMTPATIAAAVTELIRDAALAERIGTNARRQAPEYSRARRAERILQLIADTPS